jgi:hypothetical protein
MRAIAVTALLCVLYVPLDGRGQAPKPVVKPVASHVTTMTAGTQAELVAQYCTGCHNDRG